MPLCCHPMGPPLRLTGVGGKACSAPGRSETRGYPSILPQGLRLGGVLGAPSLKTAVLWPPFTKAADRWALARHLLVI